MPRRRAEPCAGVPRSGLLRGCAGFRDPIRRYASPHAFSETFWGIPHATCVSAVGTYYEAARAPDLGPFERIARPGLLAVPRPVVQVLPARRPHHRERVPEAAPPRLSGGGFAIQVE